MEHLVARLDNWRMDISFGLPVAGFTGVLTAWRSLKELLLDGRPVQPV
jgi:hypothetical protein